MDSLTVNGDKHIGLIVGNRWGKPVIYAYTFGGFVEDQSPRLNSMIEEELDDIEEGFPIWELGRYA